MALELFRPNPVGISESSDSRILLEASASSGTTLLTVLLTSRELMFLLSDFSAMPRPGPASAVTLTSRPMPRVAPFFVAIAVYY